MGFVGLCLSELRSIHCTQAAEAAAAGTGTGGLADHADETDEVEEGPQVGDAGWPMGAHKQ